MTETYKAVLCNCGHDACKDWHVSPSADVHGVSFTREEAVIVAAVLNALETRKENSND